MKGWYVDGFALADLQRKQSDRSKVNTNFYKNGPYQTTDQRQSDLKAFEILSIVNI